VIFCAGRETLRYLTPRKPTCRISCFATLNNGNFCFAESDEKQSSLLFISTPFASLSAFLYGDLRKLKSSFAFQATPLSCSILSTLQRQQKYWVARSRITSTFDFLNNRSSYSNFFNYSGSCVRIRTSRQHAQKQKRPRLSETRSLAGLCSIVHEHFDFFNFLDDITGQIFTTVFCHKNIVLYSDTDSFFFDI